MHSARASFLLSLAVFAGLAIVIAVTDEMIRLTACVLMLFAALPMLILTSVDLGRALRSMPNPSKATSIAGMVIGVNQALFGIASLALGLGMSAWVLYNTFIHRLPDYHGGALLGLGLGMALIVRGASWLLDAFQRHKAAVGEMPR